MVEKLAIHIQLENQYAEDLLKYRVLVAEAKSSYQSFEVRRIWKVGKSFAKFILSKGSDGKHILGIDFGSQVNKYRISGIESISMHPFIKNRIVLTPYSDGEEQEYESDVAHKIMQLIRDLIFSDFNQQN